MLVAAVVGLALGLMAPASATWPDHVPGTSEFARSVLTADGSGIRFRPLADGRLEMSGFSINPHQRDWNDREVFRRPGTPQSGRQTTCATWVRQSRMSAQQGLAVRIRDHDGRVRAVTLTRNVEFGIYWVFNLLTWDTDRRGDPWRTVGQYDLSRVIGRSAHHLAPLPWRVCLRATGRHVAFKVWRVGHTPTPSWRDRHHVRHARLPQGFAVGSPGWYVGHLRSGDRLVYGRMVVR